MPDPRQLGDAAELRALLRRLHETSRLSYDELAKRTNLSRSSIGNYLTKPAARPTENLRLVLVALGADRADLARALELHRRTLPGGVDPAEVGWQERARSANCKVWPMAEFTPTEAAVHTAIGRRHADPQEPGHATDFTPPRYVPRAHDGALRCAIAAAAAGQFHGLIVLRGTSSTGKTRSLFEAVHALCPGWTVIRPRRAAALRELAQSGLLNRRLVVWLNELQRFLGHNGEGLSIDVLDDLHAAATQPLVVVATIWPDKLDAATNPADEHLSDVRELLSARTPRVRWHEVPPTLTTKAERDAARDSARTDPRLARALADPDRVGFAQTLAGAHELLQHYRNAPTIARLLLEAAADARRLGHGHALTEPLLRAMQLALWRETYGPSRPPARWWEQALEYASQPLRSNDGVRALISLDDPDASDRSIEPVGFDLAEYLEQHLARARRTRPIDDRVWLALQHHTNRSGDLIALARSARDYSRYRHAESCYRYAAARGDAKASRDLAWWLRHDLPGREADAEAAYRNAAAAGDAAAWLELARWLAGQPGREADAEAAYRAAAKTGGPGEGALRALARWLRDLPDQQTRAEAVYRAAAAAGEPLALRELAGWLGGLPGREADAEAVYRDAAAAGEPEAEIELARWLAHKGRQWAAEKVLREAGAAGDSNALYELAGWLMVQPYGERYAAVTYRAAADAGHPEALRELAHLLRWLTGDDRPSGEGDPEPTYREAAAAGDPEALPELAEWLGRMRGREVEAEAAYREAAALGTPAQLRELAAWLRGRPGRQTEAEAVYREAAAAGDPKALPELAEWLGRMPGREADAEAAYREAVAANVPGAMRALTWWLRGRPGREADVEAVYREAAAAGDPEALYELADWSRGRPGRQANAEAVLREAAADGSVRALSALARWLGDVPGRDADVEAMYRVAAAAGAPTALREYARWLRHRPGRETDAEAVCREAAACGDLVARHELVSLLEDAGRSAEAARIRGFGLDAHGHTAAAGPI